MMKITLGMIRQIIKESIRVKNNNDKWKQFKQLEKHLERFSFAENNFSIIDWGSTRAVFLVEDGVVVKIVLSKNAGVAANKREFELANSNNSDLFPIVFEYAQDFSWILVEEAKLIEHEDIQKFGTSVKNVVNATVKLINGQNKAFETLSRDAKILGKRLINIFHNPKDIAELEGTDQWGVIDNRVVIVDAGGHI